MTDKKYYPPLFLTTNLPDKLAILSGALMVTSHRGRFKLDSYHEFAEITPRVDNAVLFFNDISYSLQKNRTYFIYLRGLHFISVELECEIFMIDYYKFVDGRSPLACSLFALSLALNSNIDDQTLIYRCGVMLKDNDTLILLSKEGVLKEEFFRKYVDVCLEHGLITFEDKLKRSPKYYENETTVVRQCSDIASEIESPSKYLN